MLFRRLTAALASSRPPRADAPPITREHVVWGYRLFLDREPEAELVIRQKMSAHASTQDLRREFLSSAEFKEKNGAEFAWTPARAIVLKEIGDHLRIFLDLSDWAISVGILRGCYEESESRFLAAQIRPGDSVLDIGANIGFHTIAMADRAGPEGRVYAFEPIPQNLKLLTKTIGENRFQDRVVIEPAAVGAESGSSRMSFLSLENNAFNSGGAYLLSENRGIPPGHQELNVPVVALDEYPLRRPVRCIKIDVEGAEPLAFRGAAALLREDRPVILSEINPVQLEEVAATTPAAFLAEMAARGYECRLLEQGEAGPVVRDVSGSLPTSVVFLPR